jgi:hypothetical protein
LSKTVASRKDFYFHENSHLYPVQSQQTDVLLSTHVVKSIKASGVLLGYPYNRPRSLTFGYDMAKFVWLGLEDVQSEFDFVFARSMQLSGDEYFYAKEGEVM